MINKLYLELSQVATATTARELTEIRRGDTLKAERDMYKEALEEVANNEPLSDAIKKCLTREHGWMGEYLNLKDIAKQALKGKVE